MRAFLLALIIAAAGSAQTIENYACTYPLSISNESPAKVTCLGPHGYNQQAFTNFSFGGAPTNSGTITVDGVTYTLVTSLNNAVANQVLIGQANGLGSAQGWTAINLAHAVDDDGVGKGTTYSSATTAHPTFVAYHAGDPIYFSSVFYCRTPGAACLTKTVSTSGANGSWDTANPRMEWSIATWGGTGAWAAMGTFLSPGKYLARYVDATHYALYNANGSGLDTTSWGPYSGQTITLQHTAVYGANPFPFAYTGESWGLTGKVTSDNSFYQVNLPGCSNSAHEAECALGYRIPENPKYPGTDRTISSFVVSGGVGTITLTSPYLYTVGSGLNLLPGGLITIRNLLDTAGAWTHTTTATNDSSGTTTNRLVKYIPGASTVGKVQPLDLGGAIGVCQSGCSTSGTATIADGGLVTCEFDNATTAGHWVSMSQTDDRCHDYGSANFLYSPQPFGIVQDTGAAGTHQVWMNGLNRAFKVQTTSPSSDGSSVTSLTVNTPGYPDGTYPYTALTGYTGMPFGNSAAWISTSLVASPYIYFSATAGTYTYPNSSLRTVARDQSGITTGQQNRVRIWVKYAKNAKECGGGSSVSTMGSETIKPFRVGTNNHPYNANTDASYAAQWTLYSFNNAPSHLNSISEPATLNHPVDFSASNKGTAVSAWYEQDPYFDSISTTYLDLRGLTGCAYDASGTILLSPISFATVSGEPDELIRGFGSVWAPSRFQDGDGGNTPTGTQGYDVFWKASRGPSGSSNANSSVTYEVRYSTTGSLKSAGFSTGLCQSGTTTCNSSDRVTTDGTLSGDTALYRSATMAQPANIWWAVKPIAVPVTFVAVTGGTTWIGTWVDLMLAHAGDHVTTTGITGATVTNAATTGAVSWQSWRRYYPGEVYQFGLTWPVNTGNPVKVQRTNHGYSTGDIVMVSDLGLGTPHGRYTITVVDANSYTLNGTDYATLCPSGCTGGNIRRLIPDKLASIVCDGSACTATLTVNHNLVAGWQVYVHGSTSSALTPGVSSINTAPTLYTVASTPTAQTFTFPCTAAAGTYDSDYSADVLFGIQAFPAVAISATASAYTPYSGGFIHNAEDTSGFSELALTPTPSPTLTVSPSSLVAGYTVGGASPASQTASVSVAGGSGVFDWAASSSQTWASVSPSSGSAAGTFTVTFDPTGLSVGVHTATITVTTSTGGIVGSPQTITVTFTIYPAPSITTSSLPDAPLSTAYSQQVAVTGGQLPYSCSISAGSLPHALSITNNGSGCLISGTPDTWTGSAASFTVAVTDAGGVAATPQALTILVTTPLVFAPTTRSLSCVAGQSASSSVSESATGASGYTWSVSSNQGWLTATPSSGTGAGSFTAGASCLTLTPGSYSGTLTGAGSAGISGAPTVAVSLTVTAPPMGGTMVGITPVGVVAK